MSKDNQQVVPRCPLTGLKSKKTIHRKPMEENICSVNGVTYNHKEQGKEK